MRDRLGRQPAFTAMAAVLAVAFAAAGAFALASGDSSTTAFGVVEFVFSGIWVRYVWRFAHGGPRGPDYTVFGWLVAVSAFVLAFLVVLTILARNPPS